MALVPSPSLLRVLRSLNAPYICKKCKPWPPGALRGTTLRKFQCSASPCYVAQEPFRKDYKEQNKQRKASRKPASTQEDHNRGNDGWELTVGIEIHAELNTARKLFSPARTSISDATNTHVAVFDAALPGAQPIFQEETLLPALRAAIALQCSVSRKSGWDRKHYFWWDQPNGYQITQYYEPFAKAGQITLYPHDEIDPSDYPSVAIGIKQIQMEQDTAKTVLQPPSTYLLDFNRISHPLIEIITLPHIHKPKTAAALVRKIQAILKTIGANTTGMEMGGLRADVNVSVRHQDQERKTFQYDGIKGLGQRTEIKNLSSFKAVEDAIIAERDRQITVLESGGLIEGETRGWTLGSTETKRLRGKEGEIDYRYMPDPDLESVVIGDDLVKHVRATMPMLPDQNIAMLTHDSTYGLSMSDARTLVSLDDGDRLEYYLEVVDLTRSHLGSYSDAWQRVGKIAANWILHDLPTHLATTSSPFPYTPENSLTRADAPTSQHQEITPEVLANILVRVMIEQITLHSARSLMSLVSSSPTTKDPGQLIASLIEDNSLGLVKLADEDYIQRAERLVHNNPDMASKAREEHQKAQVQARDGKSKVSKGKVMWFVGQMVREEGSDGRIEPGRAERAVRQALHV